MSALFQGAASQLASRGYHGLHRTQGSGRVRARRARGVRTGRKSAGTWRGQGRARAIALRMESSAEVRSRTGFNP